MDALEIENGCKGIMACIVAGELGRIDEPNVKAWLDKADSYAVSYCPNLLANIGEARNAFVKMPVVLAAQQKLEAEGEGVVLSPVGTRRLIEMDWPEPDTDNESELCSCGEPTCLGQCGSP